MVEVLYVAFAGDAPAGGRDARTALFVLQSLMVSANGDAALVKEIREARDYVLKHSAGVVSAGPAPN